MSHYFGQQHEPFRWKLPIKTWWATLLEINYASNVTKKNTRQKLL